MHERADSANLLLGMDLWKYVLGFIPPRGTLAYQNGKHPGVLECSVKHKNRRFSAYLVSRRPASLLSISKMYKVIPNAAEVVRCE